MIHWIIVKQSINQYNDNCDGNDNIVHLVLSRPCLQLVKYILKFILQIAVNFGLGVVFLQMIQYN